jgi:hypothetical protein
LSCSATKKEKEEEGLLFCCAVTELQCSKERGRRRLLKPSLNKTNKKDKKKT